MSIVLQSGTPKIVVLGAGSIGCYLGGRFINGGANVTFIGREKIQSEVKLHGLRLTDLDGLDSHIEASDVAYVTDQECLRDADYVLVAVKSGDTTATAKQIKALIKDTAVVISFQNGIRNFDELSDILNQNRVIRGMVPFNVINKGSGHFHRGTEGNLAIEAKQGEFSDLLAVAEKSNMAITTYEDLLPIQWGKLLMNLNNAINALSGLPLVEQLGNRNYRKVLAKSIKETLKVLSLNNIVVQPANNIPPKLLPVILNLPNWLYKKVAAASLKIDPLARSSMYEDFVRNRKTEIDFLNGEILHLANKKSIKVPVNSAIVELVKKAEKQHQGSPEISAVSLLDSISK
ncbi:2-dehydropantoate 2-reductase [Paraglaciecola arctica]|uniref:2-dehydropantoate 2-reductase n=1 Tax=Paraglaciecola arctica TaxID=1128911 RepID=UPI001C067E99|nr:2-dehydropantoate 2-reductase [Paraglaciecola arctica]MBU3004641.1 2-dehydropantoate 2-reductase [Paraglaciecola arctica]